MNITKEDILSQLDDLKKKQAEVNADDAARIKALHETSDYKVLVTECEHRESAMWDARKAVEEINRKARNIFLYPDSQRNVSLSPTHGVNVLPITLERIKKHAPGFKHLTQTQKENCVVRLIELAAADLGSNAAYRASRQADSEFGFIKQARDALEHAVYDETRTQRDALYQERLRLEAELDKIDNPVRMMREAARNGVDMDALVKLIYEAEYKTGEVKE